MESVHGTSSYGSIYTNSQGNSCSPTTLKNKIRFSENEPVQLPLTDLQPLPLHRKNTKITPWAPKIDQVLTKKF